MIRVVVADADLVDDVLRDHPCFADRQVATVLRKVRETERARIHLCSFVVQESLEQVVMRADHLVSAHRRRVGVVVERLNRHIVVRAAVVRRRNRRREDLRKIREAARGNDVAGERLSGARVGDGRRQAREVSGNECRIRHARKERLVLIGP